MGRRVFDAGKRLTKEDNLMATIYQMGPTLIVSDVLRIAHEDAQTVYGDLSEFKITLTPRPDGWHVKAIRGTRIAVAMLISACNAPSPPATQIANLGTCVRCNHKVTMPTDLHDIGLWVNFVQCPNCRTTWPVGIWLGKEPTGDEYMQMLAQSRGEEATAAVLWLRQKNETKKQ
jgi:hypothetical protein